MRKIFRDESKTNQLYSNGEDFATNDDLAKVVVQINNTVEQLTLLSNALEDYKAANQESINTAAITATEAAINTLTSTVSYLGTASAKTLTVAGLSRLVEMISNIATIANANINGAAIDTASITSANIDEATVDVLNATTANIENWSLENISATNITASNKITANEIEATTSNIGNATAATIAATGNVSVGGKVEVEGNIKTEASVITDSVKSSNIEWKDSTVIVDAAKFYLEVPHFENGFYAITFTTGNNVILGSVEVYNSVDNFFVRWSQPTIDSFQISKIYKYGNDTASQIYLEVINTNSVAVNIKYGVVGSTVNVPAPESYSTLPIEPITTYEVPYKDGQKFFRNVDLANQGGTVSSLTVTATDDIEASSNTFTYDTTEQVNAAVYRPNQSLNTDDNVTFNEVDTTFLGVRDFSTRNFIATELKTLSTIDLSEFDENAILVLRDSSTAASVQDSTPYIKKTINGNPALFKIVPVNGMPSVQSNKPLIYEPVTGTLIEATNLSIPGTLGVTGKTTVTEIEATTGVTTVDLTATGNTTLADVTLDNITASGDITADNISTSGNVSIAGDLNVSGTETIAHRTDLNTGADVVTLREDAITAIPQTGAGLVIENYDGLDNDLSVVADSTGTMRIGTTGGTLEPFATREEANDLNNNDLMAWDATNERLKHITRPNASGTVLTATVDGTTGAVTYSWDTSGSGSGSGVAFVGTQAQYEVAKLIPQGQPGFIPSGALVCITDKNDYIYGEDN